MALTAHKRQKELVLAEAASSILIYTAHVCVQASVRTLVGVRQTEIQLRSRQLQLFIGLGGGATIRRRLGSFFATHPAIKQNEPSFNGRNYNVK